MDMRITAFSMEPAFQENNIPVVLFASNLYAPYAAVLIRSIIDHASIENNYDIIILEREISEENKRLLKIFEAERDNISIRFYEPSVALSVEGKRPDRFPFVVYYSLFAPFILENFKKIIVMDSDMLVCEDIALLLRMDLEGRSVAAAQDILIQGSYYGEYIVSPLKIKTREYLHDTLGMRNAINYVNAGILLFDCEKWRREMNINTLLSAAKKEDFTLIDQDLLNVLMEGNIKVLPFAWNVQIVLNRHYSRAVESAPDAMRQDYGEALDHPYVLHWAGRPKPWICPDVPKGNEWWAAAIRTPFIGHILARMVDGLEVRREYYWEQHKKKVSVWEPIPKLEDTSDGS